MPGSYGQDSSALSLSHPANAFYPQTQGFSHLALHHIYQAAALCFDPECVVCKRWRWRVLYCLMWTKIREEPTIIISL